jgi:hypothetical protein
MLSSAFGMDLHQAMTVLAVMECLAKLASVVGPHGKSIFGIPEPFNKPKIDFPWVSTTRHWHVISTYPSAMNSGIQV